MGIHKRTRFLGLLSCIFFKTPPQLTGGVMVFVLSTDPSVGNRDVRFVTHAKNPDYISIFWNVFRAGLAPGTACIS
jgi:hypothetical protein